MNTFEWLTHFVPYEIWPSAVGEEMIDNFLKQDEC